MVQGRTMTIVFVGLAIVAGAGLSLMCAEERGLNPGTEKYRLYVATWGDEARIHVFDTESDSLLDSTDAVFSNTNVRATEDGRYFFRYNFPRCPEIWEAATIETIGELPGCGYPIPAIGDQLIFGTHIGKVDYISYPQFALLGSDSLLSGYGPLFYPNAVDSRRGLLYCSEVSGGETTEQSRLLAWDYRNHRVFKQWDLHPILGEGTTGFAFSLVPMTEDVIVLSTAGGTARLSRIDLSSMASRWQVNIAHRLVTIEFSPDGHELWRAHRTFMQPSQVPFIYIHSATSGSVIDSILLPPLSPPLVGYPAIRDLAFTPDGKNAYASAGDLFISSGYVEPVYVINVADRRIIGTILDDGRHFPYYLDIAPAP